MDRFINFKATNIEIDRSMVSNIDFIATPIRILDENDTIKDELLHKQDLNSFEHTLIIKDLENNKEYKFDQSIKQITEDIKVDGHPIGKFPIGIIEFTVAGDLTEELDVTKEYEVSGYDKYFFNANASSNWHMKNYIISEIEYRRENRETYFKGYDYGSRLSVEYDPSLYKLPMTFGQFVEKFYNNHGLEVENIDDLFQKDYQLKVIPTYDSGVLSLQVARDIAKFSLSLQYINHKNRVVIKNVQDMSIKGNKDYDEIEIFKTFREQPNNFKSLGINTLTLGLQADIDGENVSKSNKGMVDKDGLVELRLDDIPFVYNQSLKQEVIDNMFNQIKGFKYNAFESESIVFFYELGDQFKQIGQGKSGESYPVLVLERNIKKQGSMLTKNSAESKSLQETKMRWEEFTPEYLTEIKVDKANQEIVALVKSDDEQNRDISQLKIDVDGITSEVTKLNLNANLIINLSGTLGTYDYWTWEGTPLLKNYPTLVQRSNLSANTNFEIVELNTTEARWGLSFFAGGKAVTDYGFIIPDNAYSFRMRRMQGEQLLKVQVREYNSNYELVNTRNYNLQGSQYQDFTFEPIENTMYVKLAFEAIGVTYDNRLVISELMFNRGNPKGWQENANEVKVWASSEIKQLDNEISSTVEEIKVVDGKVENNTSKITQLSNKIVLAVNSRGELVEVELGVDPNTGSEFIVRANNISLEGLTTINDGFKVLPNGNTEMTNAKVSGEINAITGDIGNLKLENGLLTRENRVRTKTYTNSDLNRIQQIIMDNIIPTEQDFVNYDIDGDGRIDSVDLMLIRGMIEKGNNPTTIIYKMFLGGNDGGIRTTKEVVGVGTYNVEILGSMVKSSGLQSQTLAHPKNKNVRINLYEQDTIDMSVGRRYINLSNEGLSTQDIDAFHIKALSYTLGNHKVIEPTTDAGNQARANIYQMNPRAGHGGTIGLSSNRYSTIYLQNQPNVSSDLRYKNLITAISDDLLDVVHDIKPKQYYTIYDNKVHFGYIAQDVERALYKHALRVYGYDKANQVVDDFAMLSKDESYMSLLYGEIQVLKDAYYQRELDRQKEVNNNLQEQIDELKEMIKNGL